MYVVIMAGGGGTRLWPLSSPERPKPFLPLLGDRTLLQMTVDRLLRDGGLPLGPADVAVVTDRRYAGFVRDQLPAATMLEEPVGRNTAAAVALAAHGLDRPGDEAMLVLPADHRIADEASVPRRAGDRGLRSRRVSPTALVTLGIRATGPRSGYGYIVVDARTGGRLGRARRLPRRDGSSRSRRGPTPSASSPATRRRPGTPGSSSGDATRSGRRSSGSPPTSRRPSRDGLAADRLDDAYAGIRATSIDYAVMEPASEAGLVRVLPLDVGWSDLGSWTVLLEALGGVGTGRVVQPGEAAEAGPDDLVVERIDGRLVLDDGPRGILAETPVALLSGARPARDVVDALLERVARQEA